MTRYYPSNLRQAGFTLVEIIVTLVLMGIIGGMVAMFLRWPVQQYMEASSRAELSDIADTTVRRITRDVRLALPNSLRVNAAGTVVEFVPTKIGGRYLAAADAQPDTFPILDFDNPARLTFTAVGDMPTGRQAIASGDYLVVYNVGDAPGDFYTGGNRATVNGVTGNVVSLASNPYAVQNPEMQHPLNRFLIAGSPVTYRCAPPSLYRHTAYGINSALSDSPGGTEAVLANNVSSCTFAYDKLANTSSATLGVTLTLRHGKTDEAVSLIQQIHVNNSP